MPLNELQLGHYRLSRLLGSGGMGEVYLAEDLHILRRVAVKVIRSEVVPYPDATSAREANRLFQREARAIATLQHPHILPLFDYGEEHVQEHTFTYMVMPYCQAGSVDMWLRQRQDAYYLAPADVVPIVEQAADALQYAHQQQIIHQDVKPSNFLIRGWKTPILPDLVLADFGVAKFVSANSSTSQSIRGTPTYMAPEQWEGHPVPATDQYALAIMVYQLLTGYLPFQGGPGQIMYQHFTTQPLPPSTRRPTLPPSVDAVILRALMKRPEERFASIAAFAQALQQSLPTAPSSPIHMPELSGEQNVSKIPTGNKEEEVATFLLNANKTVISDPAIVPERSVPVEPALVAPIGQGSARDNPTAVPILDSLSRRKQRSSPVKSLLILLPILLLILSLSGALYFVTRAPFQNSSAQGATATAQTSTVNGTATAQANADATHTAATAQTNADATRVAATVQAQAANGTATAQASVPQNPYPPNAGTLALNDTLADNSKGYNWEEGVRDQGYCTFTGGSYHSIIPLDGTFHSCLASARDFSDFAFEVQMNILSGNTGGIVFRASRATTHFYYFRVDRNGNYELRTYYDKNGNFASRVSGSTAPLHGNDLIGVVAQGSTISLYVNRQLIQQITDTTYMHGQVGVFAQAGEASFNNARVWVL